LRRYGHSKLSKMVAAAILNLFESKIAPLNPPSPKPHPITKHEVDRNSFINRCLFNLRWLLFSLRHIPHSGLYSTITPPPNYIWYLRSYTRYCFMLAMCVMCRLLFAKHYNHSIYCAIILCLLLYLSFKFAHGLYSHFMLGLTFLRNVVTVCECHIALKATWLDRTTGCGDMAFWNFSKMAAAAILDLFEP